MNDSRLKKLSELSEWCWQTLKGGGGVCEGMTVNLLMCEKGGTLYRYSVNAATQTYHPQKMGSENITFLVLTDTADPYT